MLIFTELTGAFDLGESDYYAVVETGGAWEKQLRQAAVVARETLGSDFYALECWDYRLAVFDHTELFRVTLSPDEQHYLEEVRLLILYEARPLPTWSSALAIACPTIVVTEGGCHWQCFPKHSGNSLESKGVLWAEFEKGPSLTAELL
jgi:hypothetical protein